MLNEKILYQDYFSNKISVETLAEQLKISDKDFLHVVHEKLDKDLDEQNSEMLEYHIYAVFLWEERVSAGERKPLASLADILNRLLLCDWHKQHENIVTMLQKIFAESSVDVLYQAIYLPLEYLEWDDNLSFQKRCVRAIAAIRDARAIIALQRLAQEENEIIRELAERKLAQIKFAPGLTAEEMERVEATYQVSFPKSYRNYLMQALPVEKGFYNWRDFSAENVEKIKKVMNYPKECLLAEAEDADAIRERIAKAPVLLPVYAHRYMPVTGEENPPVLSVHGTDIIYYGENLSDYLKVESGEKRQTDIAFERIVPVEFWSELM